MERTARQRSVHRRGALAASRLEPQPGASTANGIAAGAATSAPGNYAMKTAGAHHCGLAPRSIHSSHSSHSSHPPTAYNQTNMKTGNGMHYAERTARRCTPQNAERSPHGKEPQLPLEPSRSGNGMEAGASIIANLPPKIRDELNYRANDGGPKTQAARNLEITSNVSRGFPAVAGSKAQQGQPARRNPLTPPFLASATEMTHCIVPTRIPDSINLQIGLIALIQSDWGSDFAFFLPARIATGSVPSAPFGLIHPDPFRARRDIGPQKNSKNTKGLPWRPWRPWRERSVSATRPSSGRIAPVELFSRQGREARQVESGQPTPSESSFAHRASRGCGTAIPHSALFGLIHFDPVAPAAIHPSSLNPAPPSKITRIALIGMTHITISRTRSVTREVHQKKKRNIPPSLRLLCSRDSGRPSQIRGHLV
jgi:hypothetical protein